MHEALAAVLAKLAGLPAAAKAVAAVTTAAAVGTAGATVVLPEAASDNAKPPAAEQSDRSKTRPAADKGQGEQSGRPATAGRPSDAPSLPARAGFGQRVAADARDGGVDGKSIAAQARQNAQARRDARAQQGERAQQDAQSRRPATAGRPSTATAGRPSTATPAPQSSEGRATASSKAGREVPVRPAPAEQGSSAATAERGAAGARN